MFSFNCLQLCSNKPYLMGLIIVQNLLQTVLSKIKLTLLGLIHYNNKSVKYVNHETKIPKGIRLKILENPLKLKA